MSIINNVLISLHATDIENISDSAYRSFCMIKVESRDDGKRYEYDAGFDKKYE